MIGSDGASHLAIALCQNKHLRVLHLHCKGEEYKGCVSLIYHFTYPVNNIGDVGAFAISEALVINTTLEELHMNGSVSPMVWLASSFHQTLFANKRRNTRFLLFPKKALFGK